MTSLAVSGALSGDQAVRTQRRRSLRVLLIGNYEHDRQESMQRFADLLVRELPLRGLEVRLVKPAAHLGRFKPAAGGVGKWLGYVDKFALFPLALPTHLEWCDVVHVCDHSNAMYCHRTRSRPTVVTCHDFLAVRGALGEDTDCPAGFAGRHLQRWILTERTPHRQEIMAGHHGRSRTGAMAIHRIAMIAHVHHVAPLQVGGKREREERELVDIAKPFAHSAGSRLEAAEMRRRFHQSHLQTT